MRISYQYAMNLVYGPYSGPFFLHLLLGPSHIAQEFISPSPPRNIVAPSVPGYGRSGAGIASYGGGYSGNNNDVGPGSRQRVADMSHSATGQAPPLDFLAHASRSSVPITTALLQYMHSTSPSLDEVNQYLHQHLTWQVESADMSQPGFIPVDQVPLRVWVTRTEVIERGDWERVFGKVDVLCEATCGKSGGLRPGELPNVPIRAC
ncbi:MAG: hypothetical protein M1826_001534 [Phylliscum demangeonii]|nr:MAG: hypothetical protein M1826_001534 [Phylliscum demangeonii]